jgi:hypothetical protein
MSTTILQIVVVLAVLTCLVWIAMQSSRPRGARQRASDNSWSGDTAYSIADSGQHHGSSGHHSGSDHSSASGDSAGTSDGGGGSDGGGDGGGGSSD